MEGKAPADQDALLLQNRWRRLIEIHNHAKSVFLLAEEFDPSFHDFIQPVFELRNGFEHIIRAKAAELNLNGAEDARSPDYAPKSFDKAIGHEYRAFFDAADWFSVCIRDRIIKTLEPYTHVCIAAVIPDYYPVLRAQIDTACKEIADIRGTKDISKGQDLLAEVDRYRKVINDLLEAHREIESRVPALGEWTRKDRKDRFLTRILLPIAVGIIVTLVGQYLFSIFVR